MALKVGELYATMRLDGQAFDRQLDQSGRRFEGMKSLVAGGTRLMATALVGATTATLALGAAAVRVGLDYNRMQQSSRAALTTLLGSAEAANAQMDKLDEFAKTSPFAKQVFIQAQQQLIGFGVSAEKVLPILDSIQNAVAAVGGSNDDITELTRIIAQVQSSGKITAETLNQLGARGVDAATIIGSQMGKTGAQIREDITKGALGAEEAIDALTTGMMARFGGATDNIKQQMDGAADRVKGAFRDIGSTIAAPFIDPHGGGYLVTWTNRVADGMRNAEQKAKPLVDLLVQRFRPALDSVDGLLERAGRSINAWDLSKVNGQLDTLTGYAPLIAGTSAALVAFGTRSLPILSTLGITGINPVVAGVAALVAASPELRAAGGDFLAALKPLVPVAGDVAVALSDAALAVLAELAPALRDLLLAAAPVIVQLGSALGPALVAILGVAGPVAGVLGDVAGVLAGLPTPVLVAATAFWTLNAAVDSVSVKVAALPGLFTRARTAAIAMGTAVKGAFGPVGLAVAAVTAVVTLFADQQAKAEQRVEDFAATLDQATGAITENTRALAYNNLEAAGYIEMAKRLGLNLKDLVDAAMDPTSAAARRLNDELARTQARFDSELDKGGWSPKAAELRDRMAELESVLIGVGVQSDALAESQERMADQIAAGIGVTDGAAGATRRHTDALVANADAQREAAGQALSLREAQLRAEEGQHRFTDALERYNKVNRDSEATDRDKKAALRDVESALLDQVRNYGAVQDAMIRNNKSGSELSVTVRGQRDAFIEAAVQMGKTRKEAAALADEYGLIPTAVATRVTADTSQAEGALSRFVSTWNGRTVTVNVHSRGRLTPYVTMNQADGGLWDGRVKTFADGGINSAGQYVPRVPQIVPGGANILWGEPETGWEAYISGKPSARRQNLAVLDEVAKRLGVGIPMQRLANGGMTGTGGGSATAPSRIEVVGQKNYGPVYQGDPEVTAQRTTSRLRDALISQGVEVA